ncbi:MAG TPA: acyl carrier protein [Burkholderiales bacterium]|nr:acyl carrier protein [Burkholderiales bacterium]
MKDTITRLKTLFVEQLHIDAPPPETDLFESGTLDSLQLVELLAQLERQFGVQIATADIDLEQLRTLEGIAALVESAGAPQDKARKVACG